MLNKNASYLRTVTILGSLPPLRALSSYCLAFSLAISQLINTEFISFKRIYPSFMYPGGNLKEDNTFPEFKESSNLYVRRNLTWYNPFTWITEGTQYLGGVMKQEGLPVEVQGYNIEHAIRAEIVRNDALLFFMRILDHP